MTEQQLKKGLFRLWIYVSVCWVCYFTFYLVPKQFLPRLLREFRYENIFDFGDIPEYFCIYFLPPVILLILGKVSFWIFKGFKKSD
jgi:hypothetical protein